jgi:hypothetical protein
LNKENIKERHLLYLDLCLVKAAATLAAMSSSSVFDPEEPPTLSTKLIVEIFRVRKYLLAQRPPEIEQMTKINH